MYYLYVCRVLCIHGILDLALFVSHECEIGSNYYYLFRNSNFVSRDGDRDQNIEYSYKP